MPKVPEVLYPNAAPSTQDIAPVGVRAVGDAFGLGIAQALGGAGKTLERAGDELFARAMAVQDLRNRTEAEEAITKYTIAAGDLHAQYSSLQGNAKVQAYKKYAQDLEEVRGKIGESVSNPMVRRMYDSGSRSTMARSIFNGAGEAATANKHYVAGTAKASIDIDAKSMEDDPSNEGLFQEKLDRVKANARILAGVQGLPEGSPQEELLSLEATSKLRAQRIIGLSRTDPFKAAQMLDQTKTELTQGDFLRVDNTVRAQSRAVGSANIANEVYDPTKTLREMEEAAKARAKALNPDDPILEKQAVAAVQGKYNQDKYATRQEELRDQEIVFGAIQSGVKDEQQLRADPNVARAIDALPRSKQLAIPGQINRYNLAKNQQTNQENYQRLYGLSNNDVEAFLNTDLTAEQLSQGDMRELFKRQQKMKENPNLDPRVDRVRAQIRGAFGAQLEALGIYSRTLSPDNRAEFDKYTGAIQAALDVWQETHKKAPTYKEVVEQIAPQIIQQRSEPGTIFGSFWPNKKSFFDQEPPAGFADRLKADVIAKGGTEPTPEQINRAWIRAQFIKLYGKPKSE